jgi:hypothetical protein
VKQTESEFEVQVETLEGPPNLRIKMAAGEIIFDGCITPKDALAIGIALINRSFALLTEILTPKDRPCDPLP